MKIAVIGATGKVGSLVVEEALLRGHDVTGIVRNASKVTAHISIIEKEIFDIVADDLTNFDVVINAFGAPLGEEQAHVDAGHTLIEAATAAQVRIIVVGGAGSLFVDDALTIRLIDTADFPDIFIPTAMGQGRNLAELQQAKNLTWTFISPSAFFDAQGKRTGAYKTGKDQLLVNSQGDSYISYADFAIAVIDEAETATHLNERFTVVGEAQ